MNTGSLGCFLNVYLFVDESSTYDDMKKAYRYLALIFHPDKNQHSQVTKVTKMINKAKEELEITLRHNDEIREEERVLMDQMRERESVHMAYNAIIILSDNKSDSGRREILPKPVTSSNKSSTFPAEQNSDNEETPLKINSSGTLHI